MNPKPTFDQFWQLLEKGGCTAEDDTFSITEDGRLHIDSRGNTNDQFRITRKTVQKYFDALMRKTISREEFRVKHSAYFEHVFRHLVP